MEADKQREIKEVIIMRGLPASGKTTKALEVLSVKENCVRLNRDSLRDMLNGGVYSPLLEFHIRDIEKQICIDFLRKGFSVVIDDTNLMDRDIERWTNVASLYGAEVSICSMNTPVEECVERDKSREKPVGESVIRGMNKKYLVKENI